MPTGPLTSLPCPPPRALPPYSHHLVARVYESKAEFRSALQHEKEGYTIYKTQVGQGGAQGWSRAELRAALISPRSRPAAGRGPREDQGEL